MSKKKIYLISVLAIVIAGVLLSAIFLTGKDESKSIDPTYVVKRGPLTISFVESGNIKARDQIILKNEVEGRTSITYIIEEGARVKKGDLLIALDVSTLEDQKIDQEIAVQNAEAAYISANENLAVVKNQAKSDVDLAILTLDFAKQDLEKYEKGDYLNELYKAEAGITLAKEKLARAEDTLEWSEKLSKEKYIPETELKGDQLAKDESELNVKIAEKDKELLEEYTYKRTLAQKVSDVNQAEMALERTNRKAHADVIQAEAELKAKDSEFRRQKDKLTKVEDQIKKTKIYAPADGLVIYATSAKGGGRHYTVEPLDVGKEVYERQELIYLPTGDASNAEITLHESNLKKTSKDLPVIITVDALPGKTFYGTIKSIAPLPDSQSMWLNPDLKVYNTIVSIDDNDPMLRTGMSCQAEIIVKQYEDAFYVPLQAVTKIGADYTVYVKSGKSFLPRQVKTGLDNNKVIRITEGLKEGDVVLLNPPFKSTVSGTQNRGVSEQNDDANATDLQSKISQGLKNAESKRQSADVNQQADTKSPENIDSQKLDEIRKKVENMTPEEKEKMRQQFEKMTPEEREKAMQQMIGGVKPQGSKKHSKKTESQ